MFAVERPRPMDRDTGNGKHKGHSALTAENYCGELVSKYY